MLPLMDDSEGTSLAAHQQAVSAWHGRDQACVMGRHSAGSQHSTACFLGSLTARSWLYRDGTAVARVLWYPGLFPHVNASAPVCLFSW